ncbi:hypothetical protein Psyaliredsea_13700 [Psychrobacter alimentarius]
MIDKNSMTTTTPLLLITADPSHPLAKLALRYARAYLQNAKNAVAADEQHNDSDHSKIKKRR